MEARICSGPVPATDERAARIVEAMRASVALHGAASSTFDHVAREERAGALTLSAPADAVARLIFAVADGLPVRRLTEPGVDLAPILRAAVAPVRPLLG